MNRPLTATSVLAFLLTAACSAGTGDDNALAVETNNAIAEGEGLLPAPAEVETLANEAAADEAVDMQVYGGNAAAGETGNAQ